MKKIIILVAIVLLTIGFASITTSLIRNGTLKVNQMQIIKFIFKMLK